MLLAIAITTVIGIPMGLTTMNNSISIGDAFGQLPQTFGALFTRGEARRGAGGQTLAGRLGVLRGERDEVHIEQAHVCHERFTRRKTGFPWRSFSI